MKVKTNLRAGSGGKTATSTDSSTSTVSGKGGVNSGGVNSTDSVSVVYYPPVSRCVGI